MSPPTSELTTAVGDAITSLLGLPAAVADTLADALTDRRGDCCTIPTPCWLPQPSGKCVLTLAPGDSGVIALRVENCGWVPRTYVISATGHLAGLLTIVPTTFLLHPLEVATVFVKVTVPAAALPGTMVVGPVLIRGCRIHFVKVVVHVAAVSVPVKCEHTVCDCPDNIHHWYDHFYCPRPCLPSVREPGTNPNDPLIGRANG